MRCGLLRRLEMLQPPMMRALLCWLALGTGGYVKNYIYLEGLGPKVFQVPQRREVLEIGFDGGLLEMPFCRGPLRAPMNVLLESTLPRIKFVVRTWVAGASNRTEPM